MPIRPKEIKKLTDKLYPKLKSNDPKVVINALIEFGEYFIKKYPEKGVEEIEKMLVKAAVKFRYPPDKNTLLHLGSMFGLASRYYSDRDEKCEEMLARNDDSLFRTYRAWKTGGVLISYFIKKESADTDLFRDLREDIKTKAEKWKDEVNASVDDIVNQRTLELAKQKNSINKLQAVCIQYHKLLIIDLKKAALTLPQAQLNLFMDNKGTIDINKILHSPVKRYPELYRAKKRVIAMSRISTTLDDTSILRPSDRLDKFNALVKNPIIVAAFTSNAPGKTIWATFLSLIRSIRVSGVNGFFHGKNKRKLRDEFTNTYIKTNSTKRARA